MSNATKTPPPKAGTYDVGRPGGVCAVSGEPLPPGTKVVAGLRETDVGFERIDVLPGQWDQVDRSTLLAFWHTTVPTPEAKKKLFVDDDVLVELFERLKDTAEPAKINFRFVLGLILMRKRRLAYESSRVVDGRDVWTMKPRGQGGRDDRLDMVDPHLTEAQVAEVSQQLGDILNEEL